MQFSWPNVDSFAGIIGPLLGEKNCIKCLCGAKYVHLVESARP